MWFTLFQKYGLGLTPNESAIEAMKLVKTHSNGEKEKSPIVSKLRAIIEMKELDSVKEARRAAGLEADQCPRFFVAVSLAEGETIRKMLHDHMRQSVFLKTQRQSGCGRSPGRC